VSTLKTHTRVSERLESQAPLRLDFQILGPLTVVLADRELSLTGKLLRALLLLFLVHARQVQTTDQLVDELWAGRPPRTARGSLQNLVLALRAALGPEFLVTTQAGYVLQIERDQLDAWRFERLVADAARETPADKVRILEQALMLWRGSPLVDVRYASFAQEEIERLEELRLWTLEELLEAKLELGAAGELVPELTALLRRDPFRERTRRQLMLALYRSGRAAEALASYTDWRRLLSESWGLEPTREMCELADDIRRRAPELERSRGSRIKAARGGRYPGARPPGTAPRRPTTPTVGVRPERHRLLPARMKGWLVYRTCHLRKPWGLTPAFS
jgi:DNA-binding SARP family transcriptional activator